MHSPKRRRRRGSHKVEEKFMIYSDGSTFNNGNKDPEKPSYGAYAGILCYNGEPFGEPVLGGGKGASINWCELAAVVHSLRSLLCSYDLGSHGKPIRVEVISDSAYVVNGGTNSLRGWATNGWLTVARTPIQNQDLWEELLELMDQPDVEVTLTHIKAHTNRKSRDYEMNDRADALAKDHLVTAYLAGTPIMANGFNPRKNMDDHEKRYGKVKDQYVRNGAGTGRLLRNNVGAGTRRNR
jgi:ribonuclease HI